MFEFVDPVELIGTIGLFVTMGIMAIFVGVYVWGSKYNKMLISRFGSILRTELGPKCERAKQQIYKSSGFRITCHPKRNVPLKNWEMVLFLLNRENLLHHLAARFKPYHDMLLTNADFLAKPRLQLEVININSKTLTKEDDEVLKKLKEVPKTKMGDNFIIKSSGVERVRGLLEDKEFLKMVDKLGDDFIRISITDTSPHLLFASRARQASLITHVRLAEKIGNYFKPQKRKPKILE
ncbi:MAG: hypothetical protein ACUVXA_14810 [Candidatus Jordarchaeum sp.]|uniref:hypothetical protein n=1 Tax=Candidatus Jordarchaeum sp. TaxID=2823881 RepID=UPI0040492DA1